MHGQNYWDTRARALTLKLMTSDAILNVYSDPAFPQFSETAATVSDVSLLLQSRSDACLYPSEGSVTAVVQNHSRIHAVYIKAMQTNGVPYTFSRTRILLLPGQSMEITMTPTAGASARYGSVTLQYDELPNLKLHKSRTQYFALG